ncbi:MAG: TonB-dependent receptor [Pseudomonadales bacterium]|nr:TonB-dependent receptor [Pseudomonadales bacterium]
MKKTSSYLALCCALSLASTGYAEEYEGLEEIVVTATKRSESLQEVGLSVTALTSAEIEDMGMDDYLDFAVRVPNLGTAYQADGRFDANAPAIRGVFGSGDAASAATTGFYIDDVPVSVALHPRVIDLERIEVLRGPQGSLYGARSMGGTIRLITQQPSLTENYGSIHSSISSVTDGGINNLIDGSINVPVVEDVLGLRVAAYSGSNSGIYDRVYQPTWTNLQTNQVFANPNPAFRKNEDTDDEDFWGGQIFAKWQVTDALTITPKFMYQKIEADGLPFADVDSEETTQVRFFDSEEPGEDEWWIGSVVLNLDVNKGSFTSTTAYYERETDEAEEEHTFLDFIYGAAVGIPITPLESVLRTTSEYENFSHETRFTSSLEGKVNFTVGVFYADNEFVRGYPTALQVGADAALAAAGGPPVPGIVPGDLIFITNQPEDVEEMAVFGEVTLDVSDKISVTVGGRWYETEVDFSAVSDGFANGGPSAFSGSQKENGFNPKVMVSADVSDQVNLYASAAKGFRIGGVNGQISPTLCGAEIAALNLNPAALRSYDSDDLWSYEVGVKSNLADNRVAINASVFMIDWNDTLQNIRLACGFQFSTNVGDAESRGAEVEISAAPVDGLYLSLGVGYTDTEVKGSRGFPGFANGDEISGVPDMTATATAQYVFPLVDDWNGRLRLDANHYGESTSQNNNVIRERDSWSAVNVRAGITNESWDITLFADNLTDERANLGDNRSIAAETPSRSRIVTNRPRTIGLEARYHF